MELLITISNNFLSPLILFFLLGIIAGVIKSDLSIPSSISKYLTIYLMMSIGFKGGYSILLDNEINLQMILCVLPASLRDIKYKLFPKLKKYNKIN